MKRLDFVIIAAALIIAAVLYFSGILRPGNKGGIAVVYVDGKEKISYSLSEDVTDIIEGIGGTNVIEIKDGKVSITEADCPDKICVNHVPVYRENESIICLPHKVVVEIQGGEKNDIDAVAQ